MTTRALWALAQEQGVSWRTLRRARRVLKIRYERVWADGQRLSYWLLPGQQLPAGAQADADPGDLEEYLAPLREKLPPPNPLDEM